MYDHILRNRTEYTVVTNVAAKTPMLSDLTLMTRIGISRRSRRLVICTKQPNLHAITSLAISFYMSRMRRMGTLVYSRR